MKIITDGCWRGYGTVTGVSCAWQVGITQGDRLNQLKVQRSHGRHVHSATANVTST